MSVKFIFTHFFANISVPHFKCSSNRDTMIKRKIVYLTNIDICSLSHIHIYFNLDCNRTRYIMSNESISKKLHTLKSNKPFVSIAIICLRKKMNRYVSFYGSLTMYENFNVSSTLSDVITLIIIYCHFFNDESVDKKKRR